jgi:hypothetical protein
VEHDRLWCYDWGTWSRYFPGFTHTPYPEMLEHLRGYNND